jgi:four helix bundle protein
MEINTFKDFKELKCWQKARELAALIHASMLPVRDIIIKDQMQRVSISIMNNISEGYSRKSKKEQIRFLEIALSSSNEIINMTYHLTDIKLIQSEETKAIESNAVEICKMLNGLIKYFQSKV